MKSKIASTVKKYPQIPGFEFIYHKHYMPQSNPEQILSTSSGFRHNIEDKGLYCASPDKYTKILAVEFTPGYDEFPFINEIDNSLYKDGFLFLGIDLKESSFFMPII